MKAQSVRIEPETLEKLKNLDIEVTGVKLKTYEDKIAFLIYTYEKNITNK